MAILPDGSIFQAVLDIRLKSAVSTFKLAR
jgi:hypothetical protein